MALRGPRSAMLAACSMIILAGRLLRTRTDVRWRGRSRRAAAGRLMTAPGAVLCDRSGFSGPVPVSGWLFICQPRLSRNADLVLPGLIISPRVVPGSALATSRCPAGSSMRGFLDRSWRTSQGRDALRRGAKRARPEPAQSRTALMRSRGTAEQVASVTSSANWTSSLLNLTPEPLTSSVGGWSPCWAQHLVTPRLRHG